jgi:D-alanine-D-alanine ligase
LSVPPAVVLPHATFRELGAAGVLAAVEQSLGLPVVVKPTKGGSALGATLVTDADALPAAMVACFSYGDTALIERAVIGTEIAVAVLDLGDGPVALPAVEIQPDGGFYDYTARYTAGMTEFFVPARLAPEVLDAAADVALAAHAALGLRGLSRSDLIVDDAGAVHLLEVNVAPGMTETSLLPQAVEAHGLDLAEVCAALVRDALDTADATD